MIVEAETAAFKTWFLPISISVYFNTGLAFLIYIRIVGRMN